MQKHSNMIQQVQPQKSQSILLPRGTLAPNHRKHLDQKPVDPKPVQNNFFVATERSFARSQLRLPLQPREESYSSYQVRQPMGGHDEVMNEPSTDIKERLALFWSKTVPEISQAETAAID